MGMLADFFVATHDEALRYANRHLVDGDEAEAIHTLLSPCEWKGIAGLQVGILWALLEQVPWDVKKHRTQMERFDDDEREDWLEKFPDVLTALLANASTDLLSTAGAAWAKTEEMEWEPHEVSPVLADLQRLARRAQTEGKSIYLWGCL